jgi:hypothetical protein
MHQGRCQGRCGGAARSRASRPRRLMATTANAFFRKEYSHTHSLSTHHLKARHDLGQLRWQVGRGHGSGGRGLLFFVGIWTATCLVAAAQTQKRQRGAPRGARAEQPPPCSQASRTRTVTPRRATGAAAHSAAGGSSGHRPTPSPPTPLMPAPRPPLRRLVRAAGLALLEARAVVVANMVGGCGGDKGARALVRVFVACLRV